ncbi:hypothetical protein GOODEAATRI_013220, partial [Goodea atripinnis]
GLLVTMMVFSLHPVKEVPHQQRKVTEVFLACVLMFLLLPGRSLFQHLFLRECFHAEGCVTCAAWSPSRESVGTVRTVHQKALSTSAPTAQTGETFPS